MPCLSRVVPGASRTLSSSNSWISTWFVAPNSLTNENSADLILTYLSELFFIEMTYSHKKVLSSVEMILSSKFVAIDTAMSLEKLLYISCFL